MTEDILQNVDSQILPSSNTRSIESDALFSGEMDIDVLIKHEELKIKINTNDSIRVLREKNAHRAFIFASIWAGFIGLFILLHGFEKYLNFKVSETEFIFVCGTLTTSILLFYVIVLKNLFPSSDNDIN